MNFKNYIKYYIIASLMIFVIIVFFPIKTEIINNNILIHHSLIDLGVADYGFASALLVGLIGFITTIYTNDKNLKATKASLIPEKSLELYNNLKLTLIFYDRYKNTEVFDEITTYIEILKTLTNYQVVLQLYSPKIEDKLINILLNNLTTDFRNNKQYEKNANKIINEIIKALLENASNNNKPIKFKIPKKCEDDTDIESIKDEIEIEINKKELKKYINTIKGEKTKKLTMNRFLSICKSLKEIIKEMDKEKEKFRLSDF